MPKTFISPLISAESLLSQFPLSQENTEVVENARNALKEILSGTSSKKILILGPCSADFRDSILEYAQFIREMRSKYGHALEIIMRFYTGKPRTVGGWKGLQNSYPGEDPDLNEGLANCRSLALEVLSLGVPIADEMLHPHLIPYMEDLLSYVAIGARSCENQYHREVASGLDMPVGFKNPTSWDLSILSNSTKAGQSASTYSISGNIFTSHGNSYAHGILRGGSSGSNYDTKSILKSLEKFQKQEIRNASIIIDASHGNSNKDPLSQPSVIAEILHSMNENPLIQKGIKGFMVEGYLFDGRQDFSENALHGLSLTDGCLGLEKTEKLIETMVWK